MTLALPPGSFPRGAPTALLRALVVLGLALLLPVQAHPQGVPTLDELQLLYLSANDANQSALRAWEGQDRRFNRILGELQEARASGDSDRLGLALAQAQREAGELSRLADEVTRTAEALEEARGPYLASLRERVEELIAERDRAVDPQERADLQASLTVTNNRVQVLLQETPLGPEIEFRVLSEITIGARDTPDQIRGKAGFLEDRANQLQDQGALIDRMLEELRDDQRRDRAAQDALADRERFGDNRPPVLPPRAGGVTPPPPGQILPPGADTTGVVGLPLTLEERIAGLEALRDRVAEYVQQVRDRAAFFRFRAGGGEWAW